MAAPVFESYTWTNVDAGEVGDVVGPSTMNVDDLMFVFQIYDNDQIVATGSPTGSVDVIPTGWTELQAGVNKDFGGDDGSVFAYYKLAEAPADTTSLPVTYRWEAGTSADGCAGFCRISGVDTTTPIADDTVTTIATTEDFIDLSEVTTTVADSLLVTSAGADDSASNMSPYFEDPPVSGHTGYHQTASTDQNVGKRETYITATSATQASIGASGVKRVLIDVENDSMGGFLLAISPPAAAAGPVGPQIIVVS